MGRADKPGPHAAEAEGDFLTRWSRRKLEARSEPAAAAGTPTVAGQVEGQAKSAPEPAPSERELTDADMPPLDSLTSDSDFTPFLSPGVSDGLRRLALRKLFSAPAFNITDGLNDYDEDYTQFAKLGNVITHEMKRMLQREQDNREQDAPPEAAQQHADAALPEKEQLTEVDAGDAKATDAAEGNNDPDDGNAGLEDKT